MQSMRAIFFFSSRRRHTRYIGDWSSDVCSSDLQGMLTDALDRSSIEGIRQHPLPNILITKCPICEWEVIVASEHDSAPCTVRSEERRVGKECSSRRWAYQ